MTNDTFDQAVVKFRLAASQFDIANVNTIDSAIVSIMQHHDKRSIGFLLLSLNDGALEDAGMFSIIHAAESFDDDTYVDELVSALPELVAKSPKWASVVMMRVLNNNKTKECMVRNLREANFEVKQSATWLCEKINERSSSFLNKTLPLLLASKSIGSV